MELVTAELVSLTPELAFFFVHSAWDLVIRIHNDLRTGNQNDSIQFKCVLSSAQALGGRNKEKYNCRAQGSSQEQTSFRDTQLGDERPCWVQDRERALGATEEEEILSAVWAEQGRDDVKGEMPWAVGRTRSSAGGAKGADLRWSGWYELKPRGRKTQGIFRICWTPSLAGIYWSDEKMQPKRWVEESWRM